MKPLADDNRITVENAAVMADCFIRDGLSRLPCPEDRFDGRGIVIAAGGTMLLVNAWVTINMLRRCGCELPIQCWYLGENEYSKDWADLAAPLGVECVDAHKVRREHAGKWEYGHARLHGWELKPYAITHCPFEEVLFLDADNMPVVDPTFLFDTPEYQDAGCIFWPDFGRLNRERQAWQVFGNVPYRDEPEVESGQIVINKRQCWQCLMLVHWFMQNSNNFYFNHVHGDKEVFHLAWRKLNQNYAMPSTGIDALPGVMCQHDFQGRRIFQHRNMRKWTLAGNLTTNGFMFESECIACLSALKGKWKPGAVGQNLKDSDRVAMSRSVGLHQYTRVGHDSRPMNLDNEGLIGGGADRCETFWRRDGEYLIIADSNGDITCKLLYVDGKWQGQWIRHERMPVILESIE